MNLLKKTIFVTSPILMLGALFACTPIGTTTDTPSAIADFDLPAGYTSGFISSMLGYTVEAYKGQNVPSHLYLIQSEKESDGDQLAKMLKQLIPGSSDPNMRMTVIENVPTTLRGQNVTLIVSEGVNSENSSYRQISAAFDGKGGPALLVYSKSVDAWDQTAVDEFLASIR
jgi:hypothetical protein